MEQPGKPPIPPRRLEGLRLLAVILVAALTIAMGIIVGMTAYASVEAGHPSPAHLSSPEWAVLSAIAGFNLAFVLTVGQLGRRVAAKEAQARHRVRQAEDKLG